MKRSRVDITAEFGNREVSNPWLFQVLLLLVWGCDPWVLRSDFSSVLLLGSE